MHVPETGRRTPALMAGVTWASFEAAAPDLAAAGRRMFDRDGTGEALLATVRGDAPPRIHPINLAIVGEGLYAFLLASAKRRDLELHGRYALHAHQDPAAPSEFSGARTRPAGRRPGGARHGRKRLVVRGRRELRPVRVLDRERAPWRAGRAGEPAAALHEVDSQRAGAITVVSDGDGGCDALPLHPATRRRPVASPMARRRPRATPDRRFVEG